MNGPAVQIVGATAVVLQRVAVQDAYSLVSRGIRDLQRRGHPIPDRMHVLERHLSHAAEQMRATSLHGHDDVVLHPT